MDEVKIVLICAIAYVIVFGAVFFEDDRNTTRRIECLKQMAALKYSVSEAKEACK